MTVSTSQRFDAAFSVLILQLEFNEVCADMENTIHNDGNDRTAFSKTSSAFCSTEIKLLIKLNRNMLVLIQGT